MGCRTYITCRLMEILLLTVAGSLLLSVFFIVGFLGERSGDSAPNPEHDSLLPLDDDDQFPIDQP